MVVCHIIQKKKRNKSKKLSCRGISKPKQKKPSVFTLIRAEDALSEHKSLLKNNFISKAEKARLRKNVKVLEDGIKALRSNR